MPRGAEPTYFERALFSVFTPVLGGVGAAFRGIGNLWRNYFYFRDVRRQNQSLREEAFLLRQENLALKNMLREFRGEKEIQALLASVSGSVRVASVIGFDSSQVYKSIVLNKGSGDGIKRDMVVLDKNARLVGRVIGPVAAKQARVQLITDEDSGVGVVSERFRVVGVLQGDAEGHCLMQYVLKTNKGIAPGEEILTSGFDGIYPQGIPVGKIISIVEDAGLFKKIIIEPYFELSELNQVAVITVDLRDL
ncbi:MAG: rod shape-determining protein MreC [Acidobacteriota bacterium]